MSNNDWLGMASVDEDEVTFTTCVTFITGHKAKRLTAGDYLRLDNPLQIHIYTFV